MSLRFLLLSILLSMPAAAAGQPSLEAGTVMEAAARLKAGEYLWAPDIAPQGPVMLVVSLSTQRAVVYRNGVPIGITTISTGRPGHGTPTGIFTVLQRQVEHRSNLYNDAPMPYMQRLTWGGIALHGGDLPGYPASHGCIRLPQTFAKLLYGVTRIGMTVIVTDQAAVPRVAPGDALLLESEGVAAAPIMWQPERSPDGPVSIVLSAADRRAIVLRNGVAIGSAPVEIDLPIRRTTAYVLKDAPEGRREWLRIALPGQAGAEADEPPLKGHIRVDEAFRTAVEGLIRPGTTVVVTADPLRAATSERKVDLIEAEPERPSKRDP